MTCDEYRQLRSLGPLACTLAEGAACIRHYNRCQECKAESVQIASRNQLLGMVPSPEYLAEAQEQFNRMFADPEAAAILDDIEATPWEAIP